MAKLSDNDLTTGLRGMVGKQLVFRRVGGKTIVSRAPRKPNKQKETASQRKTRRTFSDASRWAQMIILDRSKREYYRKRAREWNLTNAYTAAVKDFMRSGGNVARADADLQLVTAIRSGKTREISYDSRIEPALHALHNNIEDIIPPDLFPIATMNGGSDKERTPATAGVPFLFTQTPRRSLLYHALASSNPQHIRCPLPLML